jgi:hypothetical protein
MKSTKNILMTGIILATALFGSIQISAGYFDNQTGLTLEQKEEVRQLAAAAREEYFGNISILNQLYELPINPKNDALIENAKRNVDMAGERAKAYGDLLVRNTKTYTPAEFRKKINEIKAMK